MVVNIVSSTAGFFFESRRLEEKERGKSSERKEYFMHGERRSQGEKGVQQCSSEAKSQRGKKEAKWIQMQTYSNTYDHRSN